MEAVVPINILNMLAFSLLAFHIFPMPSYCLRVIEHPVCVDTLDLTSAGEASYYQECIELMNSYLQGV